MPSKEQLVATGDACAQKWEWAKAIEFYEKALEENPLDKEIHEKIIRAYMQKQDRHGYLEALSRYRKTQEQNRTPAPEKEEIQLDSPEDKSQTQEGTETSETIMEMRTEMSWEKSPLTEADMLDADAKQLEIQGKKDLASQSYIQAASLWEQEDEKDKAGIAYEKSYELSGSTETLSKLNELYGQGVKLKQSTVMDIYRKIYHMKV